MVRVRDVHPLHGFTVRLTFSDGSERDVDLSPYLRGPIFEPIRAHRAAFEAVEVDLALGTIVWPNGADVDPDVLYWGRTPAWAETKRARAASEARAEPDYLGSRDRGVVMFDGGDPFAYRSHLARRAGL